MPFKSEKQRRFLHSQKPQMAQRWEKESKGRKAPINKKVIRRAKR